MESLSLRQREVFSALQAYIEENGYPPSTRDLAGKLGIVNPTAVKRMFDIFQKKGLLESAPKKSRTIRLKGFFRVFPDEIIPLPVLGRIVAGMPAEAVENEEEKIPVPAFLARQNSKAFILKVKGDSMEPELHEGDFVVVHPQPIANPGDLVAAMIEGEATVKQLLTRHGRSFLHPLNPSYPDLALSSDFKLIGKVTGLLRKF